jgi:maltose 6'-phosphate phosphatase
VKLLTLNCHSWQEDEQLEKLTLLAETIHKQSYDVIALQEVSQSTTADNVDGNLKADNYILLLQEKLQELGSTYEFIWDYSHIAYDYFEEGIALLTKHPVISHYSFYVSQCEERDFWKTRKAVGMTIDFKGKIMSFYSCHMGWWKDDEEPFQIQMDNLLRKIASNAHPHFLIGDFNNEASIIGEGYTYVQDLGYYDTYHLAKQRDDGVTVSGEITGWEKNCCDKRIDFIFASEKVEVLSSRVLFNGTSLPAISDHFAVEAVLKM